MMRKAETSMVRGSGKGVPVTAWVDDQTHVLELTNQAGDVVQCGPDQCGADVVFVFGPQRAEHAVHLGERLSTDGIDGFEGSAGLLPVGVEQPLSRTRMEDDHAQGVAHGIVELSGDQRALVHHGPIGEGLAASLELVGVLPSGSKADPEEEGGAEVRGVEGPVEPADVDPGGFDPDLDGHGEQLAGHARGNRRAAVAPPGNAVGGDDESETVGGRSIHLDEGRTGHAQDHDEHRAGNDPAKGEREDEEGHEHVSHDVAVLEWRLGGKILAMEVGEQADTEHDGERAVLRDGVRRSHAAQHDTHCRGHNPGSFSSGIPT